MGTNPQAMWLDNLYVRVGNTGSDMFEPDLTVVASAQLYVTNVTIQGNGESEVRAIDAQFTSFGDERNTLFTSGVHCQA